MARIRSIKPDAFKSESLSRLDYFTRWTFAGLWTYLDDHGYGRADARLIRAELFPLDDDATPAKVSKAVNALHAEGCVCLYSVNGREFIHAPKFRDHQKVNRPTASKIPPCPEHDGGAAGEVATLDQPPLTDDAVSHHGGKRNREQGTGNREGASPADAGASEFDTFWDLYPKRVAKADASKAWPKALKRADAATILTGLRRHLPTWAATDTKFIPNPATWLNGDRWADDVAPAKRTDNRPEGW